MELRDFVKTKNIFKIAPGKTLSQALSTLKSSHDAAFVFDKNKYLGVINPYYSIIKTSLPGNAKIEHYLFHAPRIKQNDPVAKAARLMIESKVHYLPVFNEKEEFVGITSARRLFGLFKDSSAFDQNLGEFIKRKNQPVLTVYDTDFVSSAVHIFKKRKVSKLVVVNKSMKLFGILTYYDLIHHLITPRKKTHRGDRDGSRNEFSHQKVKNLAKTYVLTLTVNSNVHDALKLILDKKIGSVVVVDDSKTPIGILTTRDLLNLLIRHHREKRFEITAKNLSQASRSIVQQFTGQFRHWVNKLPNIQKAKLFVKEEKHGGLFKTVVDLGAGDGIVVFEAADYALSKKLNTQFVAIEINPVLILILYFRRHFHPNKGRIQIVWADMFKSNYDSLTHEPVNSLTYFIYISPWHIQELVKKISTKRRGTELVSYFYPASKGGRLRLKEVLQGKNTVYKYIYV